MNSDNVIKKKRLYVGEDFYDELINGLQECQVKESDNARVLTPRQRIFLQKHTAPIIMDEAQRQGVLQQIMQHHHDKEKNNKDTLLKYAFDKSVLQIENINKEIDERVEDQEEWGGINYIDGSLRIWRVIKAVRGAINLYNNYIQFKKKFNEKNPILEEEKRFKVDEFSEIGGNDGIANKFSEILDESVEKFSTPIAYIMEHVSHSVIKGVEGLYDYINGKINEMLIKMAAEEAAWAALSFVAGALTLGGGAVGVQALKYGVRGGSIVKKMNAISMIFDTSRLAYRAGRMVRVSKSGRKIAKAIKSGYLKTANTKIGKKGIDFTNFAIKHRDGIKRTWRTLELSAMAYDIYNVDDSDIREWESKLIKQFNPSRLKVKHKFRVFSNDLIMIDRKGTMALELFGKAARKQFDERQNMSDSNRLISKKYKREITLKGFDKIELFNAFQKVKDFFNSYRQKQYNIINISFNRNRLYNKDIDLTITDKSFELIKNDVFYHVDITPNRMYNPTYENITYKIIQNYEEYKNLDYDRVGDKIKKDGSKWIDNDKTVSYYFDYFLEKRNSNSAPKLKQQDYIKKIYNGSSLETVLLFFDELPKDLNKEVYVNNKKGDNKIVQVNNIDNNISVKLSDYIKQPDTAKYNEIYSVKEKEIQEEIKFTKNVKEIVKELENKLYVDDDGEKQKILEIIRKRQNSKEIQKSATNLLATKEALKNYSSDELVRTRILLENTDNVPESLGSLIYKPR